MNIVPEKAFRTSGDQAGMTKNSDKDFKRKLRQNKASLVRSTPDASVDIGDTSEGVKTAINKEKRLESMERRGRLPVWSNPPEAAASNDAEFEAVGELPIGLKDLAAVVLVCREMLDAPGDLPTSEKAFSGFAEAFRCLNSKHFGVRQVADRIDNATTVAIASAASGATILALSRRVGRHLLYGLAIEIGSALKKSKPLDEVALGTFGAWCLQRLFDGLYPSSTAIAKVSTVLIRPDSAQVKAWSYKARARASSLALRNLDQAIKTHEAASSQYGLSHSAPKVARSTDPIDVFNREFRRRVDDLIDFSTLQAVSCAGVMGLCPQPGFSTPGMP